MRMCRRGVWDAKKHFFERQYPLILSWHDCNDKTLKINHFEHTFDAFSIFFIPSYRFPSTSPPPRAPTKDSPPSLVLNTIYYLELSKFSSSFIILLANGWLIAHRSQAARNMTE